MSVVLSLMDQLYETRRSLQTRCYRCRGAAGGRSRPHRRPRLTGGGEALHPPREGGRPRGHRRRPRLRAHFPPTA